MTSYGDGPPLSYSVPDWPALYYPVRAEPGEAQYLYFLSDIYRFVVYWTLICVGSAHLFVAIWAVLMQFSSANQRRKYLNSPAGKTLCSKNKKLLGESPLSETLGWVWLIPLVYIVIGGLEALFAGSFVGLILGAVYNGGYFSMSTWTPLLWGVIIMLVLVVSSFRIHGGL